MSKPELEFEPAEGVDWTPCDGNVDGLWERVLSSTGERGGPVTRILRFDPGIDTTPNGVMVHDYWEEVYILEGDLTDLTLGETFTAGMYACRPPGMRHGPWTTEHGCRTFEVRYWGAQKP
jgi:hypothetical protein